jgi:hypothetical protein
LAYIIRVIQIVLTAHQEAVQDTICENYLTYQKERGQLFIVWPGHVEAEDVVSLLVDLLDLDLLD